MVLKHIGVWSAARIAGALYAAMGLLIGAIFALIALVGGGLAAASSSQEALPAVFGVVFGAGAIVILPVLYGGLGFVMAALAAALYNLLARHLGGLEVHLE